MQKVWYVAYGSNLGQARFRCYLSGGRPSGAIREYAGCRDPSDPQRVASLEVPGGLLFAGRSRVWGGGMAFYDLRAPGRVACRAYLITVDQFADVAAQEMRRPPGGEFARDLAGLLAEVESVHTMGAGNYETVTRLGVLDGTPTFTVSHDDVAGLDVAPPSGPYLRWIAAGLHEAHGWDADAIASYLVAAPGVLDGWTREEVVALAGAAPPA